MVYPPIPADAQWVHIKETKPPYRAGGEPLVREFGGWLLGQDDARCRIVDWFGTAGVLETSQIEVTPHDWKTAAEELVAIRDQPSDDPFPSFPLSRRGGLTGQFESRALSLPEGLLAAWAFRAGDRLAAARVLFPRLDELPDDRWLTWIARDLLGHGYHQQMLDAFSHDRDYEQTLALARHLSQPLFDGFQYQDRAQELVRQLERRKDDFQSFTLPTPERWRELQGKLSRPEQIEFLAGRLRLLNCFQISQPGGVNFEDSQSATPSHLAGWHRPEPQQEVINPYVELGRLKLAVADLPVLVPRVLDEDFLPTYSYWRDFHPSRTLHRVNEIVAVVVNETAKRELVDLRALNSLDEAERQAYVRALSNGCAENKDKTREQLLLETVAHWSDWQEFRRDAGELVRDKNEKVLPLLVDWSAQVELDKLTEIAELCYHLDNPGAAEPARGWLASEETGVRFWAALILLRHGHKGQLEGLDALAEILAKDSGDAWYPRDRAVLPDRSTQGSGTGLRNPGQARRGAAVRNSAAAPADRAPRSARPSAGPARQRPARQHGLRRARRPRRAA